MNVIDFSIIGIVILCIIIGLHQGFLSSALRLVALVVSWIVARMGYQALATGLMDGTGLMPLFNTYAEAGDRLGSFDLVIKPVSGITPDAVEGLLGGISLPQPLVDMLGRSILNQSYADQGLSTLGEYVNQAIASAALHVLSFVAIFVACYLLLAIIISVVGYVAKLPVLRQLDSLAGGVFGLVRGAVTVIVLFAGISLLLAIVPLEKLQTLIDESAFAPLLQDGNLLLRSLFS